MHADADWYFAARERSRDLAHQLVRLEDLARSFDVRGDYVRADQVRWDRNTLREERSDLMREIWHSRRVGPPTRYVAR